MNKNKTLIKLLPKGKLQDQDKDENSSSLSPLMTFLNICIAIAGSVFLAFLLFQGASHLKSGEIATRDIISPYAFSFESPAPDGTIVVLNVNKGDRIIASGQQVTEREVRILDAMQGKEGGWISYASYAALAILIFILLYFFYREIRHTRPTLLMDSRKILLLVVLLFLTIAIAQTAKYVFLQVGDKLGLDIMTIGFALPVAAGAMLAGLLLDFRLALGFSFLVSILLGISFQGIPFMPLYFFLGSIVAALSVIKCKKRTAILRAGAFIALVNVLAIVCIDLYSGVLVTRGQSDLIAGFLGAAFVTMVVSATLPFFESLFDIATDIKLLELMDPNQPLLKELVYKSPGTYHHSILIGNLAEAAAEAINENPILARVGAYYHDIGKIHKPEYFIENQRVSENKHDKLAPSMSSLIIASHVKDGVELARMHRLPSSIVDIIQQHHGTSLITYFYHKAKELTPYAPIAEEDYRYHGPRPRTKVAAIVMLSDAVEAASRTLENPTPQRIQALTSSIITRIFLDDQLIMCDLTLKDLRDISRSFNLILTGIFHQRIDYPGADFPGEKKPSVNYPDKKQSEEKKSGNGKHKEIPQETTQERRSS